MAENADSNRVEDWRTMTELVELRCARMEEQETCKERETCRHGKLVYSDRNRQVLVAREEQVELPDEMSVTSPDAGAPIWIACARESKRLWTRWRKTSFCGM